MLSREVLLVSSRMHFETASSSTGAGVEHEVQRAPRDTVVVVGVGSGSVVLHRAVVRSGGLVGANAVVPNDMEVPSGAMALGIPAKIRPDEIKLAKQVIANFETGELDLEEYKDEYQDELRRIIDAKIAGEEVTATREDAPPKVINLMDALRQSLDRGKVECTLNIKAENIAPTRIDLNAGYTLGADNAGRPLFDHIPDASLSARSARRRRPCLDRAPPCRSPDAPPRPQNG